MKYLIASDIHGSYYYGNLLIEKFKQYGCDRIILLGDILYHGPRNDLPKDYNPRKLYELLNQYADRILCVRGNCDADIDAMVLDFDLIKDYLVFNINNKLVYFTHGDRYNSSNLPAKDIVLVHGHTHVQRLEQHEDHVYINPGSISIPKEDSYHGFIILNDNEMCYIDIDDGVHQKYIIGGEIQ